MHDHTIWSIGIGRWRHVRLRVHLLFLLVATCVLYASWMVAEQGEPAGRAWIGGMLLVILFLSVLVHELGHLLVAHRLNATLETIVLGPLGGLGPVPAGMEPQSEMVVLFAGILANLGVCLMSAFCLTLRGDVQVIGLMDPIIPTETVQGDSLAVVMKLTFWINWLLAVINLLPAFPFDGGRIFRAGLILMYHPLDMARSTHLIGRAARVLTLLLLVLAYALRGYQPALLVQPSFMLVLLAILIYFCSRHEEATVRHLSADDASFEYDFSEGYTSLERSGTRVSTAPLAGKIVRWWQRRKEQREKRQREIEANEESRVDQILVRVHESGLGSLTTEERGLLQRVSARYRNRFPQQSEH